LDGTRKPEALRDLVVNQFFAMHGNRIADLIRPPKTELNLTLNLFGGESK
jgi:hypothetical protein